MCWNVVNFLCYKGLQGDIGPPGSKGNAGIPGLNVSKMKLNLNVYTWNFKPSLILF